MSVLIDSHEPRLSGAKVLVRLPADDVVDIAKGWHTAPFFAVAQPPSLSLLAGHLGAA